MAGVSSSRGWAAALAGLILAPTAAAIRGRAQAVESATSLVDSMATLAGAEDENLEYLFRMTVEAQLPADTFACHGGAVFGISIPGRPGKNATFHYVKQFQFNTGLSCYKDIYDDSHHCLVFPPLAEWSDDWRMLCRRHNGVEENGGWGDNRLFGIGAEGPCQQQADQPMEEKKIEGKKMEKQAAATESEKEAAGVQVEEGQDAQDQTAAATGGE